MFRKAITKKELTLNLPPLAGQASLRKRGTNVPLLFLREGAGNEFNN
jgi:hypothetical protein